MMPSASPGAAAPSGAVSIAASLEARIATRTASVAVIGQGYVGLTLASAVAAAGSSVTGIDVDDGLVRELQRGSATVPGVDRSVAEEGRRSGRLRFTTEPGPIADADVVCICVPTPIQDHVPDLTHIRAAAAALADHLSPGSLVILESTTFPGTTDSIVRPIVEEGGLRDGRDFLLAYSPERIDPGNPVFGIANTPRIVGGTTPEATVAATAFYATFVDEVLGFDDARTAEMAKLLENTFRHVNIALVNELAMFCHELGVDVWDVVRAAASKPFGFMPFFPGPGVGGHCIAVDPTYLAWHARRSSGRRFALIDEAQDVNDRMPTYVADRVGELLNDVGRSVRDARILVLGVTYKPDVGDLRGSPALEVVRILVRKGARLSFHDPYVERIEVDGVSFTRVDPGTTPHDLVLLLVPHTTYDPATVAALAPLTLDVQHASPGGGPRSVVFL